MALSESRSYHIRRIAGERGILQRADGSARFSQGGTCVVAAVYGPRDIAQRKELSDRAVIEVVVKPRSGLPGTAEAELAVHVRRVLENVVLTKHLPRTLIEVVLQVVTDDGGVLAVALTAACLALVDASLPLRALFCGVSSALTADNEVLLDPAPRDSESAVLCATFAFAAGETAPLLTHALGRAPPAALMRLMEPSAWAAGRIGRELRTVLGARG